MYKIGDFTNDRNNNFDLIRLIAAVAVIFSHAFPLSMITKDNINEFEPLYILSGGQVTIGNLSVFIFFVVSGFLITQSFERTSSNLNYFVSRIVRIFPGLMIVVLITAFVLGPLVTDLSLNSYFSNFNTYTYLQTGIGLIGNQLGLPGVFLNNNYPIQVNGSLWSLKYELLFYIAVVIFGILNLLNKRFMPYILSFPIILLILNFPIGEKYILTFSFFAAGMTLYIFRDKIPLNLHLASASCVILLISFFTAYFVVLSVIFGSYLIIYLSFYQKYKFPHVTKYGDFSYGLYIYAWPVQQTIILLNNGHMNPYINFLISFPITLVIAYMSWHLIEKPSLKYKKTILNHFFLKKSLRETNSTVD